MQVDLDKLVLRPCMDVWARPVVITPTVSQPGQPAYNARGVLDRKAIDVTLEDGGVFSDMVTTLGIRMTEFPLGTPKQGDTISIPAHLAQPALGPYLVEDDDPDGEGGMMLTLRADIP